MQHWGLTPLRKCYDSYISTMNRVDCFLQALSAFLFYIKHLACRIMKDSGKERIDEYVSRHAGSILSIEKAFGSIEKFLS